MTIRTDGYEPTRFISYIQAANSIVLTTHVNPDGDAIGSEIGLAEWLLSLLKEVRVINHSPIPYNYVEFDQPNPIVEQFDAEKHDTILREADLLIVLDVNDPSRVRSVGEYAVNRTKPVIVVDHHLEPKTFATDYFIDIDACSTGELIYKLICSSMPVLGGSISPKGAASIYTAIMTDTGSFKFPRTDSEIFRICAHLLDLGADPVWCYDKVFNSSAPSRLLLQGECLNSLKYYFDGRMAMQTLTQEQLNKTGSLEEDVDGFVQVPFQVRGVALSVFLLQLKQGWKVSFRSKGDVPAAQLAQSFGGGGHFNAAGARIFEDLSLTEITDQIVTRAAAALNHPG